MNFLGNIAWLILGGFLTSVMYIVCGLLCCITIIGIPFGYQLVKIGLYAFWPFGRTMEFGDGEPGCAATILNLLWVVCGWWEIAIIHLVCGLIFCITFIGIPFGMKHFEIAKTSLFPFGQSNFRKK